MECFVFDVDDLSLGKGNAIFSAGRRRVMLSGITSDQLQILENDFRSGALSPEKYDFEILHKLKSSGIVVLGDTKKQPKKWSPFFIPSSKVGIFARPLANLASIPALIIIVALTSYALLARASSPLVIFDVVQWLTNVGLGSFLVASAAFATCIMVHEVGHAASCYRRTGMVGGIRVQIYRGIPVFTTDVSSLCLTTPSGRAIIAITGIIYQLGFSTILLLVRDSDVRVGASLSILSAMFAIVPLPGADGYWFIKDLFQIRILGIHGNRSELNVLHYLYILGLLSTALIICHILLHSGYRLLYFAADQFWYEPGTSLIFAFFGVYAGIVATLFAKRTLTFLHSGDGGA